MRPSENRFSDGLLPAQEGKTDETDDRINDHRRIFSPQPECLRRLGEKHEYSGTNRSKIPAKPSSQTGYHLKIKIKINDAPGPLKLMGNFGVGYKAENCSYVINHLEGVSSNPKKDVENQVRQHGDFEYETVVYTDAILDEDYFGEGICHWKPDGFGVAFKATGHPEETKFNFGDFLDDLIEKKTLTKYYWKGGYPYYKNQDGSIYRSNTMTDFGVSPDKLDIYTDEQRQSLFNITVTLEEIKP